MTTETTQPAGYADMMLLAERYPELREPCHQFTMNAKCPGGGRPSRLFRDPIRGERWGCPVCEFSHFRIRLDATLYNHYWIDHNICCGDRHWNLKPEAEWLGLLVRVCQRQGWVFNLEAPYQGKVFGEIHADWLGTVAGYYKFADTPEAALAAALVAALGLEEESDGQQA